ncbi:MAG: hypothetical protein QOJ03_871 [Frankiaceae bacterium]|nr:hypothetical protein [Frankiaceae bacterium]
MDDIAALLDRAVTLQASSAVLPPVAAIEAASRRRDLRRSLASLTVVLLLVIGSVIGLASTGHASETGPLTMSAAAVGTAPTALP